MHFRVEFDNNIFGRYCILLTEIALKISLTTKTNDIFFISSDILFYIIFALLTDPAFY